MEDGHIKGLRFCRRVDNMWALQFWPWCLPEQRCAQPTLLYSGPGQLCKRPVWSDHGWTLERGNSSRAGRRVLRGRQSSVALSCRRLAGFNEKSGIYWALNPDNGNLVCTTSWVRRSLGGEWRPASRGRQLACSLWCSL